MCYFDTIQILKSFLHNWYGYHMGLMDQYHHVTVTMYAKPYFLLAYTIQGLNIYYKYAMTFLLKSINLF